MAKNYGSFRIPSAPESKAISRGQLVAIYIAIAGLAPAVLTAIALSTIAFK